MAYKSTKPFITVKTIIKLHLTKIVEIPNFE